MLSLIIMLAFGTVLYSSAMDIDYVIDKNIEDYSEGGLAEKYNFTQLEQAKYRAECKLLEKIELEKHALASKWADCHDITQKKAMLESVLLKIDRIMEVKIKQYYMDYVDEEIDKNIEISGENELVQIYTFDQLKGAEERIHARLVYLCCNGWPDRDACTRKTYSAHGEAYKKEKKYLEKQSFKIDYIMHTKLKKLLLASKRWK